MLSVSVGPDTSERFVLCHLTPGSCEQWSIDLGFGVDEEVHFHLSGKCPVHLTGFYELDKDDDGSDDSEEDDADFDEEMDGMDGFDEMDDDDDDEEEDDAAASASAAASCGAAAAYDAPFAWPFGLPAGAAGGLATTQRLSPLSAWYR